MINALLSLSATQRISVRAENLDLAGLARGTWDDLASDRTDRDVDLSLQALPAGRGDPG
jgi:hypothetical protein